MAGNPREMLEAFHNGVGAVKETSGEQVNAFMNMLGACDKPGELDAKQKELISIGIALVIRCEYCIVYHVYEALKAGATKEEIMEAAMVALTFGAGPTLTYTATLLKDSIEEFAPDFA
ncbi:carboxymuconolactone decarboxylase family protein [Iocasia frigidifontis]|uniref:Carboxymuconolactone decarboxylase family protein n=1 Tax=Iocasia fonsfrigidae TaxID=2682810 RepID=A0A8A7KB27_9FIRM|nr:MULTISPECIES: carboxymuconolactone decarboxylase family protein [Halanaerobiaceae]AZO95787.1 carboxymuconolactone decarboxylase family protein [Halocella sp. SP3-1]MTI62125.1 carboxymuconolactone decarboxylase family protein [Bacillota bacterium]QTL98651.1 carboxymuconolactone decarboxylase family protein [Iocasia fonsfrigidae]